MMRVRVWVDKTTALRAGNDLYELQVVVMPASALSDTQREELSHWGDEPPSEGRTPKHLQADFYLDDVLAAWPDAWDEAPPPNLAEATAETVLATLDRIIAAREHLVAATIAYWETTQVAPCLRSRLVEAVDELLLVGDDADFRGEVETWSVQRDRRAFTSPLPPATVLLGRDPAEGWGKSPCVLEAAPKLASVRPALPGVFAGGITPAYPERDGAGDPIHDVEREEILRRASARLSESDVMLFAAQCAAVQVVHFAAARKKAEAELPRLKAGPQPNQKYAYPVISAYDPFGRRFHDAEVIP